VAFTDWGPDTPNGPFGSETTAVVTSTDGGARWSAMKDLAPRGSAYRVGAPSLTASRSGVFAVTWASMDFTGTTRTLFSASQDGGASWSNAAIAAGDGEIFVPPPFGRSTVFDREGRLYTTWHGFPNSGTFSISVAGSNSNLTAFNASSFTIRFQTGVINSTGTENLAADNASRVFVVWEVPPSVPGPKAGVYVRTVTGAATGDVQGVPSATVTLRSSTNGTVRQVPWSGRAFLLPELPPDDYRVWIDAGNGSSLAGSMPVRPWSQTSFMVLVSGIVVDHAPQFPWLLVDALLAGVIAGGAALPFLHYTRLTRETVLQRKARLLLYEYIRDNPGASFSVVRDAFGLQNGAASYHLSVLEKQGFLHSETKGRRHFYYPNGNASLWKDLPLSELQNAILEAVRTTPGIGLRELGRSLGRGPSSVGYNVKALGREGLLRTVRDGLRLRCYPAEGSGAA
jgi:predicted transcriptional regulator